MAKALSAEAVVRLWSERGQGATETVRAGVNAVTESPMAKAAAQVEVWAANVQRAKQKFVDKLTAVTLQQWKAAMLGKGLTNMSNGYVDPTSVNKFANFMRAWLPYVRQGAAQIRAMPKGTLQQGIDRAVAQIRWNAGFRGGNAGPNFNPPQRVNPFQA